MKRGLPLCPDGKQVAVAAALDWMSRTLDPAQVRAQRRSGPAPSVPEGGTNRSPLPDTPPANVADPDTAIPDGDYLEAKRVHEWTKARRAALEYDRARGRLIDAELVDREQFARGRAERDSWQSWVHRIAPILAAELQADEHAVFVALQREVDDHLEWLADTPLETLGAGNESR
ncbi:hypothetical protein [uncultured Rhodospira sp.]|uniref:hypothetical protein n=1 Tax=uncultured Rhodospira sp. TaxID=1936189 RepID=UPI00261B9EEC|nr:hypothetical protein [uncultured Rhodospira sp.]